MDFIILGESGSRSTIGVMIFIRGIITNKKSKTNSISKKYLLEIEFCTIYNMIVGITMNIADLWKSIDNIVKIIAVQ